MPDTRKRATFTLPAALKDRLRVRAAMEDIDMSDIATKAIRDELDRRESERDESKKAA